MIKPYNSRYLILPLLTCILAFGFTNLMAQDSWIKIALDKNFYSGVPIACTDVNGDTHDDLLVLDNAKHLWIGYNYGFNRFLWREMDYHHYYPAWSINCADLDRNGFNDIVISGESTKLIALYQYSDGFVQDFIDEEFFFSQSASVFDFNQDGWLDFTICDDNQSSKTYLNDGTGNLIIDKMLVPLSMTDPTMEAGNYGCIWTDIEGDGDPDLYISKCRPGVEDSADLRRINQLFIKENGLWKERAKEKGIALGDQSWTTLFEDFDNDGDKDCFVVNHYTPSRMFRQNSDHSFTDITQSSGLFSNGIAIQAIPADFDNDGDLDILMAGSSSELWTNDGLMNFTQQTTNLLASSFSSCAIADFNEDGFMDVYTSYANLLNLPSNTRDALWINPGNEHHFVQFILKGTISNTNGIGAQVKVYTGSICQSRELHAGESFGIQNSLGMHFGLGDFDFIDSVTIFWPSGQLDRFYNLDSDRKYLIEERGCLVHLNRTNEIQVFDFCQKPDTLLQADTSLSGIIWNNGAKTDSIQISEEGIYFYTGRTPDGCAYIADPVVIRLDPETNYELSERYSKFLCEGETIELSFQPEANGMWSNGSNQYPLIIDRSGTYFAKVDGYCHESSTDTLQVSVYQIPEKPNIKPDTLIQRGKASLTGPDDNTYWYDEFNDFDPLYIGQNFISDSIWSSRYFFAEWRKYYPYPFVHGGMKAPIFASSPYHASFLNNQMIFEVYQDLILDSVSLNTDDPGIRIIDLMNNYGQRLDSVVVNLNKGYNQVYLGFKLSAAESKYILMTNIRSNQMVFGENSPKLYRSDKGFYYPFFIEDKIKIISSDKGDSYYYYFFDWVIRKADHYCVSDRVEVPVLVMPISTQHKSSMDIEIVQKPGFFKIVSSENIQFTWSLYQIEGREIFNSKAFSNEWVSCHSEVVGLKFANIRFLDGKHKTIILMPIP